MTVPRRRLIDIAGLGLVVGLGLWLLWARPTEPIDSYAACAEAGYPIDYTNPPTCKAGFRTFVGVLAPPTPTPPPGQVQSFDLLVQGDSGGAYSRQQEVFTTLPEFVRYWRRVHQHLSQLPPILPIDFTTHDVVALSLGQQETNGYNLKVTSIITSSAGSVVNVTESIPTITCKVDTTKTNRYFIARTKKLTHPVSFRITTDRRKCE